MQPVLPSNNYYPIYCPPSNIPIPAAQPYYPQMLDMAVQDLHLQPGDILYVVNPNNVSSGPNPMYICPGNDPRFLSMNEAPKQFIPPQPVPIPRMDLQYPICRRCCKNPVGFKAGKPMKTCAMCLKRLRKYQKENFKRRESETNSVICSTCNRKPAMIRGNKQYHTCKICSERKKSAYHEDRARTRYAVNFFKFAMQHYDDLPQEIFSPVLPNTKLVKP